MKTIEGAWKFTTPHAPEGYQQGSFLIQEKEDTLTGNIKFTNGTTVELKNIIYAENVLRFVIYLEGYSINIKTIQEGGTMKGTAAIPDGNLSFEAKKVTIKASYNYKNIKIILNKPY